MARPGLSTSPIALCVSIKNLFTALDEQLPEGFLRKTPVFAGFTLRHSTNRHRLLSQIRNDCCYGVQLALENLSFIYAMY